MWPRLQEVVDADATTAMWIVARMGLAAVRAVAIDHSIHTLYLRR